MGVGNGNVLSCQLLTNPFKKAKIHSDSDTNPASAELWSTFLVPIPLLIHGMGTLDA